MAGQPVRREREGRSPAPGARGYSWAPFAEGHTVSTRHGAFSERRVHPLAVELMAGLLADRADLERFPEVVMAWARAEARCVLLAEWQVEHGFIDDEGNVRGGKWVGTFERLAQDLRARLGLDPRSEAELVRESAQAHHASFDLEAVIAKGRAVIEAREAADSSGASS
jgi:hypothetical protein